MSSNTDKSKNLMKELQDTVKALKAIHEERSAVLEKLNEKTKTSSEQSK